MNQAMLFMEINSLESEIKPNRHILHLVLTFLTGVWIFVWVGCALSRKSKNDKIRTQIRRLERQAMMTQGEHNAQ